MPGRSGTRENRCPRKPPQRSAKSMFPRPLAHAAEIPVSRPVSLLRYAVRSPKRARAEFPRSRAVPGATGPSLAANSAASRDAAAHHGPFWPAFSRKRPELPAKIHRSRPLRSGTGTPFRCQTPSSTTAESVDTRISVARVLIPVDSHAFSQGPNDGGQICPSRRATSLRHASRQARVQRKNPEAGWPRDVGFRLAPSPIPVTTPPCSRRRRRHTRLADCRPLLLPW